jgi:hypothetical protein
MTDEWRIGKDLEGSGRSQIEVLSRYLLGRGGEIHENPNGSQCPGRDSNRVPPEYITTATTTRLVSSRR